MTMTTSCNIASFGRKDKLMPSLLSKDIPLPYGRRGDVRRAKPTPFRALTTVVWALTSEKDGRQITKMTTREDKEGDGNFENYEICFSCGKGLMNFDKAKMGISMRTSNSDPSSSIQVKIKCSYSVHLFLFCGPTKKLITFWLWTMTWLDFSRIPGLTTCWKKWSRGILEVPQLKRTWKQHKKNHSLTAVCWRRYWCHWPGVAPCADS